MAKAYGYVRVSTGEQCQSLESQAAMAQARAAMLDGVEWGGVFSEITSAANTRYYDRPEFQRFMAVAQPDDVLIVWKLSRLERSAFAMVEALSWIDKNQIRLIVLDHMGAEMDLKTGMGRMIAMIYAGFAEMQIEDLRGATRDALKWRKDNGYAHNTPPFGFKIKVCRRQKVANGKPLKIYVPVDPMIIDEIVQRMDSGESYRNIGRDFMARDLRCNGKPWAYRYTKGACKYWIEARRIKKAYDFWKQYQATCDYREESNLEHSTTGQ